jgi:hypothetical protein
MRLSPSDRAVQRAPPATLTRVTLLASEQLVPDRVADERLLFRDQHARLLG